MSNDIKVGDRFLFDQVAYNAVSRSDSTRRMGHTCFREGEARTSALLTYAFEVVVVDICEGMDGVVLVKRVAGGNGLEQWVHVDALSVPADVSPLEEGKYYWVRRGDIVKDVGSLSHLLNTHSGNDDAYIRLRVFRLPIVGVDYVEGLVCLDRSLGELGVCYAKPECLHLTKPSEAGQAGETPQRTVTEEQWQLLLAHCTDELAVIQKRTGHTVNQLRTLLEVVGDADA